LLLRFLGAFVAAKLAPFFGLTSFGINIIDRLLLIALVLYVVGIKYRSRTDIKHRPIIVNSGIGVIAGILLFVLAQGLEQFLGHFFVISADTHPLAGLAVNARSFREFMAPFFIGAVLAPVSEELYYRRLSYPVFKKHWGVVIGLLVSAIFFAVLHFQTVWFVEIVLVAMVLGLLYEKTGSLLPSIIAHSMVNGARLIMIYFST